jgi:hypothetical protein
MKSKVQLTLLEVVLLVLGAASGLLFLFFKADLPLVVRIFLKILPISLMGIWILSRRLDRTNAAIFVGLVCAVLGDATLELGSKAFVPGIALNVAALVCYTVYFVLSDRRLHLVRLILPLVLMGGIYAFLVPSLGSYAVPVAVYCLVYVLFLWRSASRIGDPEVSVASQWVCLSGCVIITVSDALLSLQIFQPSDHWYTSPFLSMALWWTGQLMMTITAEIREKKRRAAAQ